MKKLSYLLILLFISIATITNAETLSCFDPETNTYTHTWVSKDLEYSKTLKAYKIPNITDTINTCKCVAGDNYIPVVNSLVGHYKLIGTYDLINEINNTAAQKKINDDINNKHSYKFGATLIDFEREAFSINGYELVKTGNKISKLTVVSLDDLVEIDIPEVLNKNEKVELIEREFLSIIKKMPSITNEDQAKLLTSVMIGYAHQDGFNFPMTYIIFTLDTGNKSDNIIVCDPLEQHTAYTVKNDGDKLNLDVDSAIRYPLINTKIDGEPIQTQDINMKTSYEIVGNAEKYIITGKSISIAMLDYNPGDSLQKLLALSIINKINTEKGLQEDEKSFYEN